MVKKTLWIDARYSVHVEVACDVVVEGDWSYLIVAIGYFGRTVEYGGEIDTVVIGLQWVHV